MRADVEIVLHVDIDGIVIIKDLEEWKPDIYTSGNTKLQDEKFIEQLSKNIFIYESETILGPFTKAIVRQFNEINKGFC